MSVQQKRAVLMLTVTYTIDQVNGIGQQLENDWYHYGGGGVGS